MLVRRLVTVSAMVLVSALVAAPALGVEQAAPTKGGESSRAQALLRSARESLLSVNQEGNASPQGTLALTGRCCVAMDYDPEYTPPQGGTGAVVMYGGKDNNQVYAETWAWDGASWQQVTTTHSPGALRSVRMVWDAAQHELVMFGGTSSMTDSPTAVSKKTWLFKNPGTGFDWIDCSCDVSQGTVSPGLAYDAYVDPHGPGTSSDVTQGRVLEFGGIKGGSKSSDTFAFDGMSWSLLTVGGHPVALASPGMAFHIARNKIVLFGGRCDSGSGCNSFGFYGLTWVWDGTATPNPTWTQLSITNPSNRTGFRLAYDGNLGTTSGLYLFGGENDNGLLQDTWYLPTSGNWVQCTGCSGQPTQRGFYGFAYDQRNTVLVLFGGGACETGCNTFYGDTWTFDSTGWHCKAGC